MSHNDYTKYARETKVASPEEPEVVEVSVIEPVTVETPVKTVPVVEPVVDNTRVVGHVIGCSRLNVRRAPKPRAEVLCEINCDTEVEIDEANSTVDFYKICTVSGIEGYCVKTYISVKS